MLEMSTHTSEDTALNLKTQNKKSPYCWNDTRPKFWGWCSWLNNPTVASMRTDIWGGKAASQIPSKGLKVGSKDNADAEGFPRLQSRWKSSDLQFSHIYLKAIWLGENRPVQ